MVLMLTVAFGAGLGVVLDSAGAAVLSVGGAVLFALAVGKLDDDRSSRIAAASGAIPVAIGAVAAGLGLARGPDRWVVGCLALATALVAVETTTGFTARATRDRLVEPVVESGKVILVGSAAVLVGGAFVAFDAVPALARLGLDASTANPVGAFLSLQVGLLACGTLLAGVDAIVREWDLEAVVALPADGFASRFRVDPLELPRWYLAALLGQAALAVSPVVPMVETVLASQPVVGRVVRVVLLSGVLQALVGLALCLLLGVLLGFATVRVVVTWTRGAATPGRAVALGSGGSVVVGAATVLGLLTAWGVVTPSTVAPGAGGSVISEVAVVFAAVFGGVGALALLWVTAAVLWQLFDGLGLSPDDHTGWGYTAGSALLFCATVVAVESVPAPVVFAGAAAALAVWHLGRYALDAERDLQGTTPSRRTQVVQTTGLAAALAVGVAVAFAVGYGAVPLVPSVPTDRAVMAVVLSCLCLLTVLSLFRRPSPQTK
jgi:hypothetical protein